MIPKLYNGRNKTFFFGAYQGFRYSKPEDSDLLVPTAAELAGNEADNGQPQIYNPYATTAVGTGFTRPAFPGNQIPAALIDPRMVAYAKFVFPAAGPCFGTPNSNGAYSANAIDTTPLTQVQNEFDVRGDQNFGAKDSAWFRYSFINSTVNSSGGLPNLLTHHPIHARNWGGSYVHVFSPTQIVQAQFSHTTVLDNTTTFFTASTADIISAVGFSRGFASGFAGLNGGSLLAISWHQRVCERWRERRRHAQGYRQLRVCAGPIRTSWETTKLSLAWDGIPPTSPVRWPRSAWLLRLRKQPIPSFRI